MKNNVKVYKITSPNGKVYIGQTINTQIRWNRPGWYNREIKDDAYKFGWENFKKEVLFDNLSREWANLKEIELIKHYQEKGISYNKAKGGYSKNLRLPTDEELKESGD